MNKNNYFLLIAFIATVVVCNSQTVTTLAGSTQGFLDGAGSTAKFDHPIGLATDSFGNIYVADAWNHKIRKITPAGVVITLAGSTQGFADGQGAATKFNYPQGVATDVSDNIYVADYGNNKIRKITPTGVVSTLAGSDLQGFADGIGASAQFCLPIGVATDASGNVYVADQCNNKIRKISQTGVVTTLAGSTQGFADGTGTAAQFNNPIGIATDISGNVYVGDIVNYKIRKITPAGEVSTLAGSTQGFLDGAGSTAKFDHPIGLATDSFGNIYVADQCNNKIRKISQTGVVTTLAGSTRGFADGTGATAQFSDPQGIATDAQGNMYISNFADFGNHNIRKITQQLGITQNDISSKIIIYPNPAITMLTIQLENSFVIDKINVIDLTGKVIITKTYDTTSVNVEKIATGMYIIEAYFGEKKFQTKFIKQ
jgi:sugar lactone lactonase YvrE